MGRMILDCESHWLFQWNFEYAMKNFVSQGKVGVGKLFSYNYIKLCLHGSFT